MDDLTDAQRERAAKDYAAWIEDVFAEVGRRANATVQAGGSDRVIGPYRVTHGGPQSEMGNVLWTASVNDDLFRRVRNVGMYDWRTFTPGKVADAIVAALADLERG